MNIDTQNSTKKNDIVKSQIKRVQLEVSSQKTNNAVTDKVVLSKEGQLRAKEVETKNNNKKESSIKSQSLSKKISGSRFVNKPAIFFIGGFNFFSASTNDGMKDMAEHVRGARFYNWDQKSDMVKEIAKRPAHQPVILVGHSLGGDTAVEIAQELNSLEHNFKKVNLLVTLDSFGLKNDIIPQNVEKNMNFIGHESMFLNDGPNIARDASQTVVLNELRNEEHTELDDSEQIQYKILNEVVKFLPVKKNLMNQKI